MGLRKAGAVAAAAVSALSLSGQAAAAPLPQPLIVTGDIDVFEDVLEHISVPLGEDSTAVHQWAGEERPERSESP